MSVETIKLAAKASKFYDHPLYVVGTPMPDYYCLFRWKHYGYCVEYNVNSNSLVNSSEVLYGNLIESYFNTVDRKIAYFQGLIQSDSFVNNTFSFLNSAFRFRICKEWINDIASYMSEVEASRSSTHIFKDYVVIGLIGYEEYNTSPLHSVVRANPIVINFIKNYKFEYRPF